MDYSKEIDARIESAYQGFKKHRQEDYKWFRDTIHLPEITKLKEENEGLKESILSIHSTESEQIKALSCRLQEAESIIQLLITQPGLNGAEISRLNAFLTTSL